MEIKAVVGNNMLVVDNLPKFVYKKEGELIVGECEGLFQFSKIDPRGPITKIHMEDGSVKRMGTIWTYERNIKNLTEITVIDRYRSKMWAIFIDNEHLNEISKKVLNYGIYEFQALLEQQKSRDDAIKYKKLYENMLVVVSSNYSKMKVCGNCNYLDYCIENKNGNVDPSGKCDAWSLRNRDGL